MRDSLSPRARRPTINSWLRISATCERTVRAIIPVGITDKVRAGSSMNCRCAQSHCQPTSPIGPPPVAGSSANLTLQRITSSIPSQ
ncbi:Uncharacterised protein [Klebsiella aerogenes]|nr:Uncharacterised protein [Klebsiella aerogenes]